MKRINKELIFISLILAFAFLLRIWGVSYDLPYIYHADEPKYVVISQNIFKANNLSELNPQFFNYPSLFLYINAFAYIPYYLLGKFLGIFTARSDILAPVSLVMGVAHSPMPTTILLGRIVTILFGVGTVGLTFVIGKQLTSKLIVGLLASLIVAISPTNVGLSRLITPDTFVAFFAAAAFLATVYVYQQGKDWHYVIAGIFVGFTASSKYNGALILLPLLLAHFLRKGKTSLKDRNIYIALLSCGFGFLATTPFALFDFPNFWHDLKFESRHYSTGHMGMEGNVLQFYLNYMWQTGNILYVFSGLEILRSIFFRVKGILLLSFFSLTYFTFINNFVVRNDRTFLPLTPFLFLLATSFTVYLWGKVNKISSKRLRQVFNFVFVCIVISSFVSSASFTVSNNILLTTVNSRETARVWVNNNLPSDAKIAIEAYSPFIDPSRFSVQGIQKMIDHDPKWYLDQDFDYLIFSQRIFGRFYAEPKIYGHEIQQYDVFFTQFHLIKLFTDGGYEVRIYQIDKQSTD